MADYTLLISWLRCNEHEFCHEAAAALTAQAGEIERLKQLRDDLIFARDREKEFHAQQRARADELQQVFDLRWKADMRAIKRWQEANPGKELVWPDHADLCVWLMERAEAAEARATAQAARVEQLERVLAPFTKYYDLNDCHERDDDDVLEVPVRDLRAAAALAAPETPASGEGWMPIETAPKDGTLVLLFCRYENPSDDAVHIGSWSYAINSDEYDCWWSKQADDEVVPTFWKPYTRPLPAPPKEGV